MPKTSQKRSRHKPQQRQQRQEEDFPRGTPTTTRTTTTIVFRTVFRADLLLLLLPPRGPRGDLEFLESRRRRAGLQRSEPMGCITLLPKKNTGACVREECRKNLRSGAVFAALPCGVNAFRLTRVCVFCSFLPSFVPSRAQLVVGRQPRQAGRPQGVRPLVQDLQGTGTQIPGNRPRPRLRPQPPQRNDGHRGPSDRVGRPGPHQGQPGLCPGRAGGADAADGSVLCRRRGTGRFLPVRAAQGRDRPQAEAGAIPPRERRSGHGNGGAAGESETGERERKHDGGNTTTTSNTNNDDARSTRGNNKNPPPPFSKAPVADAGSAVPAGAIEVAKNDGNDREEQQQ